MSRDIFVQDLPAGILSVEDTPDDFVPPLLAVTRSEVVTAVRSVMPNCDVSDPSWIALEEPGKFHIEINLGTSERLEQDTLAANQGSTFRSGEADKYHDAEGRVFTFLPLPKSEFTSGFISLKDAGQVALYNTDINSWPLASGERMRSVGRMGCIEIDNPFVDQRLILDFTDANKPRRSRLKLSTISRNCTCPLPDECLAPRYE